LAHEQGSSTAAEEFSRKSRVIAGAIQFLVRSDSNVPLRSVQVIFSLVSHKALRWLSPAFATSAFLASIALASTASLYMAAAAAQATFLAAGLAGCAPTLRQWSVVALAHYFCLVQGATAVGVVRGFRRRQSVLWRRFTHAQLNRGYEVQP
jgi:hypothetical protein